MENTFNLYESKKGWQAASKRIQTAVNKLVAKPEMITADQVLDAMDKKLQHYSEYGAWDTESRDGVWLYAKRQLDSKRQSVK